MVSIHLIIKSKYITILNALTMIITSWLAYYAFLLFIHFSTMFKSCGTMYVTFTSSLIYLDWIVVIGINCLIDFFFYSWRLNFERNVANTLMNERKLKGNLNDSENNLPKNLEKYVKMIKRMDE